MKTLILTAILFFAVTASAAPLSGRVTDSNGRGVAHVLITAQVIAPCNDTFSASYMTNPFGYYYGVFSPGGCNIVVSASYRGFVFGPSIYLRLYGEDWTGMDFVRN